MRWVKLFAVLSLWAFFFALVAWAHFWISVLRIPNRWKIVSRLVRSFTLLLRFILNIKVTVLGNEGRLERGGYVIISNHLSYVDGIVLGSIFPVVYVTKKEVKRWPIIGLWNQLCGAIFIDRQHRQKISGVVEEITRKLKQEANVLLFPEGTSTNGDRMLRFQTAPLAGPLRARCVIVPVTLVYKSIEDRPVTAANRDLVYWYGDMDFISHFWRLMAARSVEALVTIQPAVECFRYPDNSAGRKQLAEDCYARVLGQPVGDEAARESAEAGEAGRDGGLLRG
ncbi:MAG TPA: lysophospholipid acyltransferase family protein [candidate division Zixibacteria bacterium]|nr:lysophospholipid acyltransferase family protein [candidate division Zixibacteria bacterium]